MSQGGGRLQDRRGDYRYRAFISYSRADSAVSEELHRALERLWLPWGLKDAHGAKARALRPIFRDVDELAASSSLGMSLEDHLRASEFLIVLCSPSSAASEWVNREIEYFISLGRRDRILTVLVDGEAVAWSERTPDGAFAPALTGAGEVPLAADFRGDRRARRRAIIMLAAGLLGVSVEALQRRFRRRRLFGYALAGLAVIAAGVGGGLYWRDATITEARNAVLFSPDLLKAGRVPEALDRATFGYRVFGSTMDADENLRSIVLAASEYSPAIPLPSAGKGWFLAKALFARDSRSVALCWGHYDEATWYQYRIDVADLAGQLTPGAPSDTEASATLPDGTQVTYNEASQCERTEPPVALPPDVTDASMAYAVLATSDGASIVVGRDRGRVDVYARNDEENEFDSANVWTSEARVAFLSEIEPGHVIAGSDGGDPALAKLRVGRVFLGERSVGPAWQADLIAPGSIFGAAGLPDGRYITVSATIGFEGEAAIFSPSLVTGRFGARPQQLVDGHPWLGVAISPRIGFLAQDGTYSYAVSPPGGEISAPAAVRDCDGGEIGEDRIAHDDIDEFLIGLDSACVPADLPLPLPSEDERLALLSVASTPDGRQMAALFASDEGYAVLISSADSDEITRVSVPGETGDYSRIFLLSKDSFVVAGSGYSGPTLAQFYDAAAGRFAARGEPFRAGSVGTADGPTMGQRVGNKVYVRGPGTLSVTDIETMKALRPLALDFGEDCYAAFAVSPSEKYAVAGGSEGQLCILDMVTGRRLATTRVGSEQAEAVGWLKDDALIGVMGHGIMQVFDVGLLISDPAAAADRARAEYLAAQK